MGVDEVRRYMEAAMGKLSPAKAQDMAKSMVKGQGREQVTKTAKDLLEWSNKNRERLTELIRSEVHSQMKTFGVATREDLDALRKRVRELERAGAGKSATKRSTAKRSTGKRSAPKKVSAEPSPGGSES
jgi:polyhydroxyalkanoate synthesis regulator phasin